MSFLDIAIDKPIYDEHDKVNHNKQKFAVFKFNDARNQIVLDQPEGAENTMNLEAKPEEMSVHEFFSTQRLPENEVRFAIYTYDITLEGGYGRSKRDKCLFISWCPGGAKIKDKMIFASTKATLKKELGGFPKEIQAGSYADLASENIIEGLSEMNNIKLAGKIVEFEGTSLE